MSRSALKRETVVRPSRGWCRAVVQLPLLGLAFLIVACATQDSSQPLEYDEARTQRLFSIGYEDIQSIYIEDVLIADLAEAGLDGLGTIDPAVEVVEDDRRVALLRNGENIGGVALPLLNDTDGWGEATARLITLGRNNSPTLAAAEPEAIYEEIFTSMLSELDGFSRYAGRDAAQENRASRDGFGGIGVRIRLIDQGVKIMSVMEDTPAEEAGLQQNDVIVAIDGVPVEGMSQHDVVSRLRGSLHSIVALTVAREESPRPLAIDVERAHIIPQTVAYKAEGGIAYIEVSGFNQNTTRSLREKIELAQKTMGHELIGYVLDLRDNPGGLLDQAISVSDLFIDGGRILTTEGRHPDSFQYFESDTADLTEGRPVAVLVNGGSASASEIVAGALQDSGRAVVVGSVSFGKGTVQTLLRLPNKGELTLTWARFHAPSGYALHRRGVLPDVCTSGIAETDVDGVLDGVRNGTGLVDHHLRNLPIATSDETAIEELRAHCPANDDRPDVDLEVAKRILLEPELYARAIYASENTADLGLDSYQQN